MFEITVLVPVVGNDGIPFTPAHFDAWESYLADVFGGFSVLPGEVKGGWKGVDGRLYTDHTRRYVIAVHTIADGGKVVDAAGWAKAHFAQEAMYVAYLGVSEIL